MNENYDKHRHAIIAVACVVVTFVACCSNRTSVKDYDVCGIDSAYITDSIGEPFLEVQVEDTITKVDRQGNVYKYIVVN